MAYDSKGLGVIGSSKRGAAPGLFTYKSTDAVAEVNTAGYFNKAKDILSPGDFIRCITVNAQGVVTDAYDLVVLTNANGIVDVSDGQDISTADAD